MSYLALRQMIAHKISQRDINTYYALETIELLAVSKYLGLPAPKLEIDVQRFIFVYLDGLLKIPFFEKAEDVRREIVTYAMEVKRMGNKIKYQELQDQMFKALADKKINQGTCANVNKLLILAEIYKIEAPKELRIDGKAVSVIWRSDIHCSVYAKTSLASIQRVLEVVSTLL